MNRKSTTEFLGELLRRSRFSGVGKHWASEVSLDYGTINVRRVDFMQFEPANVVTVSGLEKGIFTSYEVKSCRADYDSGFGKNFETEKNYFVMPMELYIEVKTKVPHDVGVMCPVPRNRDKFDEFENPTSLDADVHWEMKIIKQARQKSRKRSMVELLFCMLRAGH